MKKLRLLIADDSKTDRLILQALLKEEGYAVYIARDGQEAIDVYSEYKPDIVLIDAIMPNVDGYDATKAIKILAGDSFVPIIFLTSLTDADSLAKCLEVGGDDFLSKPYNHVILKAKVEAFARMLELHKTVRTQRDEIESYHDELISEQHLARKIFDNIAHSGCLDDDNIRYNLSPMSVFNGDILLAAIKPSGTVQVFLGDFTGHSLPAAIGAMPVSEIFYGMTLKGISMEETLKEINGRLNTILPTGFFCCGICIEIDYELKIGKIWNGGLPDAYMLSQTEGIKETYPSKNLALGILNNNSFNSKATWFDFSQSDSLFFASDGIIESESPTGEMFGTENLVEILNSNDKQSKFEQVLNALLKFSSEQTDDVSFLEIFGKKTTKKSTLIERNHSFHKDLSWKIDYCFDVDSLKSFDPVPLMVQPLMEVPELRQHRSQIFTIISELYSNALEHGVLALKSSENSNEQSFTSYFKLKEKRLKQLSDGEIKVEISLKSLNGKTNVIIDIIDTGKGFDVKSKLSVIDENPSNARGLHLLNKLSSDISFNEKGNQTIVKLSWEHEE